MSVVATMPTRPQGSYTVDDLDAMPDDGRRYEILDGELLVSPSPFWPHQSAAGSLYLALELTRPPDLRVVTAPYDVQMSIASVLEPDLLVARIDDLPEVGRFQAVPLLVVEVLSKSSKPRDRGKKKRAYERYGIPAYWIVDPDWNKPTVTVFELRNGRYDEVAVVIGSDSYDVTRPFPFQISPERIVADQRRR